MSKNWLITGASSGLGRGLVERALARGDGVVATLRKAGALAIVRLSGPRACAALQALSGIKEFSPRYATRVELKKNNEFIKKKIFFFIKYKNIKHMN